MRKNNHRSHLRTASKSPDGQDASFACASSLAKPKERGHFGQAHPAWTTSLCRPAASRTHAHGTQAEKISTAGIRAVLFINTQSFRSTRSSYTSSSRSWDKPLTRAASMRRLDLLLLRPSDTRMKSCGRWPPRCGGPNAKAQILGPCLLRCIQVALVPRPLNFFGNHLLHLIGHHHCCSWPFVGGWCLGHQLGQHDEHTMRLIVLAIVGRQLETAIGHVGLWVERNDSDMLRSNTTNFAQDFLPVRFGHAH